MIYNIHMIIYDPHQEIFKVCSASRLETRLAGEPSTRRATLTGASGNPGGVWGAEPWSSDQARI